MTWQILPLPLIYLLDALLALGVIYAIYRRRQVKGATWFIFLACSVLIWSFFTGLEYAVVEPSWKIIFAKFEYLGIATTGIAWLFFALSYFRKEKWLTARYILLLSLVPLIAIIAAFTNEIHNLLWTNIVTSSSTPGANLIYYHGPIFWLIFIYNYLCMAIGTFIMVDGALRSKEIYRWQIIGLIACAIFPWIGNAVYVSGLDPIPGLDLTPLGFTLSIIFGAWSIFYFHLFDLVPIARDQLVENLIDGVFVLDAGNRIADINPTARSLLGINDQPVIGHNIGEFLQAWPKVVDQFRDVESAQTEIHFDNSRISDLELRISPLRDERNNTIGRLIVTRDISDQKKLEVLRDNLIHAIVHDLRNPLTSVVLAMDLFKMQSAAIFPKEQQIGLETARHSVERMLEMVDTILDISRMENKEMPVKRESVSLHQLTEEAVKTQEMIANRKRITVQQSIVKDLPNMMVDPELMRRVLQNLLDNAIKYSLEGGLVTINARCDDGDKSVLVSVSNSGPGVSDDLKPHLFEKFASGRGREHGSGLGLAFCRLAVEAHGGRIWLEEGKKPETTIFVKIPIS